jgi:hypothetical protein
VEIHRITCLIFQQAKKEWLSLKGHLRINETAALHIIYFFIVSLRAWLSEE